MATLLDFFKKIPSKNTAQSSPAQGDTADVRKSTSPGEQAKVFTLNSGKENKKISPSFERNSHVRVIENGSPKQSLSRKRAESDKDSSDDDEVTGRKVSNNLCE